jgi:hypothetical protein
MDNPFNFIDWQHILILWLAAFLRLLRAYSVESDLLKAEKKNFVWQIYFADRWDNWLMHVISMILGLLLLPGLVNALGQTQFMMEYVPMMKDIKDIAVLNLFFTSILGYAGYDAVDFVREKIEKLKEKFK